MASLPRLRASSPAVVFTNEDFTSTTEGFFASSRLYEPKLHFHDWGLLCQQSSLRTKASFPRLRASSLAVVFTNQGFTSMTEGFLASSRLSEPRLQTESFFASSRLYQPSLQFHEWGLLRHHSSLRTKASLPLGGCNTHTSNVGHTCRPKKISLHFFPRRYSYWPAYQHSNISAPTPPSLNLLNTIVRPWVWRPGL